LTKIQGFLCQITKFTRSICKNQIEILRISTSNDFVNTGPIKKNKCFKIRMTRSLCIWNFMDLSHGQIYSSGSLDMEWPFSPMVLIVGLVKILVGRGGWRHYETISVGKQNEKVLVDNQTD